MAWNPQKQGCPLAPLFFYKEMNIKTIKCADEFADWPEIDEATMQKALAKIRKEAANRLVCHHLFGSDTPPPKDNSDRLGLAWESVAKFAKP